MKDDIEQREQKLIAAERKIQQLEREIEDQNRLITTFFADHDVTLEQMTTYAQQKERFSEKDWQRLEELRQIAREKSQESQEEGLIDLKKVAQERRDLAAVRPNWIFVR